jgi:hypothetical protein
MTLRDVAMHSSLMDKGRLGTCVPVYLRRRESLFPAWLLILSCHCRNGLIGSSGEVTDVFLPVGLGTERARGQLGVCPMCAIGMP